MDDRYSENEMAERLLAADGLERRTGSGKGHVRDGTEFLETLLDREEAMERRVRRAAIGAWGAVLALVPLLGVGFFVVRVGGGLIVEVSRAAVLVVGVLAILALFLAVILTVAWLIRSRSTSLAVIERRLAALEELLSRPR